MSKLLLNTLNGKLSDRVPFWFMRQAGRYLPEYRKIRASVPDFLSFCYNPELATEVTLQPIRRYGMDGAILFADILIVPDGLGQKVWFEVGHGPRLTPVTNTTELDHLSMDGFHSKVGNIYETIRRLKVTLPQEVTLLGFAGAPWTIATYMVEGAGSKDHGAAKSWGYSDPIGFKALLDLIVEATAEYLIAQIEAGVDAVQIFDSWAGGLSETTFNTWVIEPTREIVNRIKAKYPNTPIIGFPRLAGPLYEQFIAKTGVQAVSIDTAMPLEYARTHIQNKLCIQGNMDPRLVVTGGAEMLKEADRILNAFKNGPHVFNLGHGFVPETPPENVEALVNHIKAYRR
mgnify:CR=1 FL=1|jgi:uroporphyrinogen decarboxylase